MTILGKMNDIANSMTIFGTKVCSNLRDYFRMRNPYYEWYDCFGNRSVFQTMCLFVEMNCIL